MENREIIKEIVEKTDICDRPVMMKFVLGMLEPTKLRVIYNALKMNGDLDKKPKDYQEIYI